jgi:hypothetical protein
MIKNNYFGYFHIYLLPIIEYMGKISVTNISRELNHIFVSNCVIVCGNLLFPP